MSTLALDHSVVDLGKSEFSFGLTNVALVRVRTIKGLLIKLVYKHNQEQCMGSKEKGDGKTQEDCLLQQV